MVLCNRPDIIVLLAGRQKRKAWGDHSWKKTKTRTNLTILTTQNTIKNCNPYRLINILLLFKQPAYKTRNVPFNSIFVYQPSPGGKVAKTTRSPKIQPQHLGEFTTSRITAVDIVKTLALDQSEISRMHTLRFFGEIPQLPQPNGGMLKKDH